MLLVLTGCANNPIDTANPTAFRHRSGIFELQVPKSWKSAQDQVETEVLAAFSDPNGQSEIIAYTGLLDHELADEEGLKLVPDLVKNLLNSPSDLAITNAQRRADGAFVVSLTFTRKDVKRAGQAVLKDGGLALSGLIASGPQDQWPTLQTALQPVFDSFKLNADYVQGTFFTPIEKSHFALVVPADWERASIEDGTQVRSRNGLVTIIAAQKPVSDALDAAALSAAATRAAQAYVGQATVSASQTLPDGRLQQTLDTASKRTISYAELKDGMLITLLFEVPAAQATAYQPLINFMYSTLVTGKP
ncbi:MAG: hypothetical protein HY870_05150 [Chloroflexi bacterium]|nr:hypothetical protein [Chloroflexota bacterium]